MLPEVQLSLRGLSMLRPRFRLGEVSVRLWGQDRGYRRGALSNGRRQSRALDALARGESWVASKMHWASRLNMVSISSLTGDYGPPT